MGSNSTDNAHSNNVNNSAFFKKNNMYKKTACVILHPFCVLMCVHIPKTEMWIWKLTLMAIFLRLELPKSWLMPVIMIIYDDGIFPERYPQIIYI